MHRPALDIYSDEMVELTDSLLRDLSKLFATKGRSYIHIANGHGAWEAALSNVLSRGDEVAGAGKRLLRDRLRLCSRNHNGLEVEVLTRMTGHRAIDPAGVEARLRQGQNHEIGRSLRPQVDTALQAPT